MAKNVVSKDWSGWVRASDGYLRSDDPLGLYGSTTPALPVNYVDTTYSLPTGGTTHTPANSAAFATALTNAVLGDVIVLDKNVTYVGPFTLPNKTGTGWIYIISSDLASLPSYGEAWTNCVGYVSGDPANIANWDIATDAAFMPKITGAAAGDTNAITNATSAHHYRFVGCEIKNSGSLANVTATVALGSGCTLESQVPTHIIFDRCYIHGSAHATAPGIRGVQANGENIACVGCYISDYFVDGADTQAIFSRMGDGPFKFVNNFLQASGENIMIGGADPTIPGSVPSDIEIRHNVFYKPTSWVATAYDVKNHLEFKNAQRAWVKGNLFVNNWLASQSGFFFLITPRNQSGTAPWCIVQDITFELNKCIATGSGIVIAGRDDNPGFETLITNRVMIRNNLILADGNNSSTGDGFQLSKGIKNLHIKHNTVIASRWLSFSSAQTLNHEGFVCRDNVWYSSNATLFAWAGDSYAHPKPTLDDYFLNDYVFDYNVLTKGSASGTNTPAGNFVPATSGDVGFTNFAGGDYSLTGASAYHNAASDGTDIGCDFTALAAAIA